MANNPQGMVLMTEQNNPLGNGNRINWHGKAPSKFVLKLQVPEILKGWSPVKMVGKYLHIKIKKTTECSIQSNETVPKGKGYMWTSQSAPRHDICQNFYTTGVFGAKIWHTKNSIDASQYTNFYTVCVKVYTVWKKFTQYV